MMANPAADIQQCIQKCQQTIQQLQTMSNQETNPQMQMMLREGAHHLELCIEECKFSAQELQSPTP